MIQIKYFQRMKEANLLIRDNGIGMDSEMLESIFRLDSKKKNRGVNGEIGVGLGLVSREKLQI